MRTEQRKDLTEIINIYIYIYLEGFRNGDMVGKIKAIGFSSCIREGCWRLRERNFQFSSPNLWKGEVVGRFSEKACG